MSSGRCGRSGGTLSFRPRKFADVSKQLFEDSQFLAAGRGFAINDLDIPSILFVQTFYLLDDALFVEADHEDFAFQNFRRQKRQLAGLGADVVPGFLIESRDRGRVAEHGDNLFPIAIADADAFNQFRLRDVAMVAQCRRTSGEEAGKDDRGHCALDTGITG